MTLRPSTVALALALAAPTVALAQIDQTAWGLTTGFSPRWTVPTAIEGKFDVRQINIAGREFRIGVIRGTTFGGEWGVSLVHKRLNDDSDVSVDGSGGVARFVTEDAELLGAEVHRFLPFGRVGDRVQIGANLAGGIAQVRGFVRGEYQPFSSTAQSFTALVPTRGIFEYVGREVDWLPLGRAELGVTTLLGDRAKVRVTSGFNFPGYEVVNFSFSYLLGQDR
jgi:hypothetical protein